MSKLEYLVQNKTLPTLGGIKSAGIHTNGSGVLTPDRVLKNYALAYIFKGVGHYEDETGVKVDLTQGDVVQIPPDIHHWYGPPKGAQWNEIFILFEGPIFDLWYQNNFFDLNKKRFRLPQKDYWFDRFVWACGKQHTESKFEDLDSVIRLQQLLADIHKTSTSESITSSKWIDHARATLQKENNPHSAADALEMKYETFRKKFTRLYGVAPKQYLINEAINTAKNMLKTEDKPIYTIATQLGYCDEFHFSKQFTNIVGCSPSTYRSLNSRIDRSFKRSV